jgi:hypothetical protein
MQSNGSWWSRGPVSRDRRAIGLAWWLSQMLVVSAVALDQAVASDPTADDPAPPAEQTTPATGAAATSKPPSKLRSPDDGWLDMSGFLDKAYGFVPLVIPITEPAVGYGAAAGLVFIDRTRNETAG